MKFLITADIHLSRYGQDKVEDTTNLPERLHSIKNVLYDMGEYCFQNKITDMVIAGDLLHGKSIIYAIAQDVMIDFFSEFKNLNFFVLDGNHDLSGKSENAISALKSIRHIPNVTWISKHPVYHIDEPIVFIPYSANIRENVKDSSAKILISHFGLNEGMLNSGISIVSDIKLKDLVGKYELVLLGHYHKPQEISNDSIRLFYTGSPIQLDWGEKNDEKRFLVVDTKTLEVKSVKTTGYKKHIELELTNKSKDEILKIAQEESEKGNYIKILKKEVVDIKDLEKFNVVDKSDRDITNRGITSSMAKEEKLKRFLEIKEISPEETEDYLKYGIEIINSCEGDTI
jgi:DNA repair exonuclease SbcCD nuclease subunit